MLGFPCNQFGEQEPKPEAEIKTFVEEKYDVDFPMFAKINVNGDDAADLYKWLKAEQPGEGESAEIAWNFEKFLVSGDGAVIARFGPKTTPEEIAAKLPALLPPS